MKMSQYALLFFFFLVNAQAASGLELDIRNNTLILHANQVPLQDILQGFVARGISVRIDPAINPPISAEIRGRDLEDGLKSVLKSINYALDWKTVTIGGQSHIVLSGIQIFRPGREDFMQNLPVDRSNLSLSTDPRDGSLYVRNELLVSLLPGFLKKDLEKILVRYPVSVEKAGSTANIFRVIFSEDTDILTLLDEFSRLSGVNVVEPNYAHQVIWPYKSFHDIDVVKNPVGPGISPVAVAVLDSGLEQNKELESLTRASLDAIHPGSTMTDVLGHGTRMAYIASGIILPHGVSNTGAKQVPLIPIRVFDDNGFTSSAVVMESIDFALANGARVINMSWGSETRSLLLEKTFEYARAAGIILVASAGNEPSGRPVFPAAYPSVIGVGALAPDGRRWQMSNYGEFVSVYAPGFASLPAGDSGKSEIYVGTSVSAALVTNEVAAILAENPQASQQEISDILTGRRQIH